MKKLILASITFSLLVQLGSCKKEEVLYSNDNRSSQSIEYRLDEIPILENNQEIDQLIKNERDKDEEKLNNYLYEIGLATKDLIKNS